MKRELLVLLNGSVEDGKGAKEAVGEASAGVNMKETGWGEAKVEESAGAEAKVEESEEGEGGEGERRDGSAPGEAAVDEPTRTLPLLERIFSHGCETHCIPLWPPHTTQ